MLLGLVASAGADRATDALEKAMEAGDYARAVKIATQIERSHPTDPVAAYNLGCALSRAGSSDEAIAWLTKAGELGYAGIRSIDEDADLQPVRGLEAFARVRELVAANAAARFEKFKAAAADAEPTIVLPRGLDPTRPTPLVVALHGTGGTGAETARTWKGAAASIGAILIAPDALRPAPGTHGYSWTFRDESEWLVLRTIEEAKKQWAVGPVILVGFSQGANIALMIGQSHADLFAGVVPVCGHYESDVARAPTKGSRPRWCLLTGELDPAADTYTQAEAAFKDAGMQVHRYRVPGMGHAIPPDAMLQEALAWSLESATTASE